MAEDNVTLEFIARRLDAIQNDMNQFRNVIDVQTGIVIRVEGALNGLIHEIAGLRSMVLDHDKRLRELRDKAT